MAQWLDPAAPTLARALKQAGYATGHFGKWHMGGQRDVGDAPAHRRVRVRRLAHQLRGPRPARAAALRRPRRQAPPQARPRLGPARPRPDHLGGPLEGHRRLHRRGARLHPEGRGGGQALLREPVARRRACPVLPAEGPARRRHEARPLPRRARDDGRAARRALRRHPRQRQAPRQHAHPRLLRQRPRRRRRLRRAVPRRQDHALRGGYPLASDRVGTGPHPRRRGRPPTTDPPSSPPSTSRLRCWPSPASSRRPRSSSTAKTWPIRSSARPRRRDGPRCSGDGRPTAPATRGDDLPDLAVREGRWKLLCEYDGSRPQLYDLAEDRAETTDLAGRHAEVVGRLTAAVLAWHRSMPPDNGPTYQPTPARPPGK